MAGVDGTLEGRLTEPRYRGRLIGKTGSLTRVSTLTGYLTTPKAAKFTRSPFLCNNFRTTLPTVRAAQDRLLKRLIEGGRPTN